MSRFTCVCGHVWVFKHGITGKSKLYAPAEDTR